MFCKMINGGLVAGVCISQNLVGEETTEAEYNAILDIISNRPTAPDGYGYRLRTDLTWELYELPVVEAFDENMYTEEQLATMTNAELQAVMADMGISGTMNKANMISLIIGKKD